MKIKRFNGTLYAREVLFLLAWSMFVITIILQGTIWYVDIEGGLVTYFFKSIRYCSYLLCFFVIISQRIQKVGIICSILVVVGLGIGVVGSLNKTMLLYSILIVAAYQVDSSKIIRTSLFLQAFILFVTILLSRTGIIKDYIFGTPERLRHGLGFCWGTIAPIMFFYCMLQYIYLRRNKIKTYEYVLMEIINIIFFKLTDARMTFYFSSLFLFIFCTVNLYRKKKSGSRKKNGKWKYFFCVGPTVIAVASILLHAFYDENNTYLVSLNRLLSGRLALGRNAIESYGIHWFGSKIEWIGFSSKPIEGEYNYVDCSYLQLLIEYGIIFLICVIVLYTILLIKAIKENDNYLFVIIYVVLIFSITEPRLMNFAYNPFPLLLFAKIRDQKTISLIKSTCSYNPQHQGFEEVI